MTREAARQVLQETLRRVDVPCFVGDGNGRIVWLNDAAKAAFGDRAGDLYTDVVAPEDVERVTAEVERMRSGALHSEYEIDAILGDGRRRRVEVSSVPIGGNAIFHGIFGIVLRPRPRGPLADRGSCGCPAPRPRLKERSGAPGVERPTVSRGGT
jgi:PAS domain S-box-containing protein